MKILKRVLWSLLALVVVFMVIGLFLPSKVHIEREIIVKASASDVYDFIAFPTNFSKWSPWYDLDTNAKYVFFDPYFGKGAGFSWSSNADDVGNGKYEIIETVQNKQIDIALDFGEMGTSYSSYIITENGADTKLTWTFDTDMGNWPPMRWMGLMMDNMLGKDYEKGLAKFKTVIEKQPKAHVARVYQTMFEGANVLSMRGIINPRDIGQTLAKNYGAIMKYMQDNNIPMTGMPFARYHTWSSTSTDIESGIPIGSVATPGIGISSLRLQPGQVVVVDFFGPYERSEMAHDAAVNWAKENGKKLDGAPWEVYVTDPGTEPDPSKWLTQVYYRIL